MRPLRCLVVTAGLLLGLSGCDFDLTARTATLTYTDDARASYFQAMEAFRAKDWESAKALFTEVRRLFTYSRYARLAELRLADIEFEQERYSEAISGYREFVQSHKNDPDIEYARYRMTKALFLDIDDTIVLPPQEERDQATTNEAHKELRSFLREFPRTRYRPDVVYMLDVVIGRLVRHELYVARYYLRQDIFDATIARIDHALKAYPTSTLVPEALVLKGETLMKMKKLAEARAAFEVVTRKHGGPFALTAKRYIAEIDERERRAPGKKPEARPEARPDAAEGPQERPAAAP